MEFVDDALKKLAEAYGVATDVWTANGEHVVVSADTLRAVLAAMGVEASTTGAAASALAAKDAAPWRRILPPCVVVGDRETKPVDVHVTHGDPVRVWIEFEDGSAPRVLPQVDNFSSPRSVDGRLVGEASFAIPSGLPLGYHYLHAESNEKTAAAPLIVTPTRLELPASLDGRRIWGLAAQLYSVRSYRSWGVGDLADLAEIASWAGTVHDAGFVLVNPLHAAAPVRPMEPSPYLPATRRFANPVYLRIEDIPEFAYLDSANRAPVDRWRDEVRNGGELDRVDRDAAWSAKRSALEVVFEIPRTPARELDLQRYRHREGRALSDFATWSAITEIHGRDWRWWPPELRDPRSPEVAEFAEQYGSRVAFHAWLQWLLDDQLGRAQQAALRAGTALGIVHDLAVGVDAHGADTWATPEVFAQRVTVGAPPDPYNQSGQDWEQPPWRPDRLAELAYEPFRQMVTTVLRHAGGLRVDHVIGLFRLWWIPDGAKPTEGTYVRYDHEALIGILALEAHRAGAVVVGEDLGTVEPWVRDYLRERGVLGTSVLWFEYDGVGGPLPAQRWREDCLASVTTHDLPPTLGYLAGDHVRLRHDLGLLTRPLDDELASDQSERRAWLQELVRAGDLDDADAPADDVLAALHRYLGRTPSRLLCMALADAVGDRRAQNQPGTRDEYPNWRIALTDSDGRPAWLEEIESNPRTWALARIMRTAAAQSGRHRA